MPKLHDPIAVGDQVTTLTGRKVWTVMSVNHKDGKALLQDESGEALTEEVSLARLKPAVTRECRDQELQDTRLEGKKSLPPLSPASEPAPSEVSARPKSTLFSGLKGDSSITPRVSAPTGPPHVEVVALAGTGKTTTLIEGVKSQRGLPTKIAPSPQQAAVWEQLKLGRSDTVTFGAFGHDIAAELKRRLADCGLDGMRCEAKTMHGLGLKAIHRAGLNVTEDPSDKNEEKIVCELLDATPQQLRKEKPTLLTASARLAGLCKLNLKEPTHDELELLSSYYDVDTGNEIDRMITYDLVPRVLERSKDPRGSISFDDMVWLPNALDLRMWKSDLFLGDECQDWNRAQEGIARKSGHRLVLCGDENQSIFGFAGADVEGMVRRRGELGREPRGMVCLPLTVTRRCGRAIVEEAKKFVPTFEAHPDNPEGEVKVARYPIQPAGFQRTKVIPDKDTYLPLVQDGDMVLCRTNAPLVSQCFKQISLGRSAFILGRAFGQGLVALVEKLNAKSVFGLVMKLEEWRDKEVDMEQAKKFPSESRLQTVQDKYDCIMVFCRDVSTPSQVVERINLVFSDTSKTGIRHSSIHKAKGLEAQNVFFLQPAVVYSRAPKTAWEAKQEANLEYVAITRAIGSLTFVN